MRSKFQIFGRKWDKVLVPLLNNWTFLPFKTFGLCRLEGVALAIKMLLTIVKSILLNIFYISIARASKFL